MTGSMITKGSIVEAYREFTEFEVEDGYLVLHPGATLEVQFVGSQGEEVGWLYGKFLPDSGVAGWFPESVVKLPSTTFSAAFAPAAHLVSGGGYVSAPSPDIHVATDNIPLPPPSTATEQLLASPQTSPVANDVWPASSAVPAAVQANVSGGNLIAQERAPWDAPCAEHPSQDDPQPQTGNSDQHHAESQCHALHMSAEDSLPEPGFADWPAPKGLSAATRRGLEAASNLPMAKLCDELRMRVLENRVVVVDAATGSGKSTLVPLCLAMQSADIGRACRIVVTQPRRIAAKGLAKRVAQQCGTWVGDIVAGYRIGNDREDRNSAIVYVTAGHLLEALIHNPKHLETFSHVVLDEVHERFVQADFLAALLRMSLSRPETLNVRIVVMSATLQQTFDQFFRPLLLPSPKVAQPGRLSLQTCTPYEVKDLLWNDIREQWPEVFQGGAKPPSFHEHRPSRAKHVPSRRRSDNLTRLCKELAPICARLLCHLRYLSMQEQNADLTPCVALVFLPGLDQMREVEERVREEARKYNYKQPEIFLMHSALEEAHYKDALDPAPGGAWRVVLATNIAESSLTVPGVNAVVDSGLHRVAVYDDSARMSMLVTEWCSKASMIQRRGRTGRTCNGFYVRLLPQDVLDELPDFDESGVEKAPLGRVVLEAAHLAKLLSEQPKARAGLPVAIADNITLKEGVVAYYDGPRGGWHVWPEIGAGGIALTTPESTLQPLEVDARRVLSLLPTPPKEDRVISAVVELRDLGALSSDDAPTSLGTAYLKLPVDIGLGRLVVLGWVMDCAPDAIILAAAFSLSPSCDILRTPFNMKSELHHKDLRLLLDAVVLRKNADAGSLSEPLVLHALCMEWLRSGGGDLGRAPHRMQWRGIVHERLWGQFTEKLIELSESLLRLLPEDDRQAHMVRGLLGCARGRGSMATASSLPEPAPQRKLMALLAWALAPLGFVALGQTPALYGSAGGFNTFMKAVRTNGGTAAGTLWWPKLPKHEQLKEILNACGGGLSWKEIRGDGECFVGVEKRQEGVSKKRQTSLNAVGEMLCRICGPFNGKEAVLATDGSRRIQVRPPRNPCMINWYMPRTEALGMLEVRVNWKSMAETMLDVPLPSDRTARCRPKRFLVACGGEVLGGGPRRTIVLRGSSVLPAEDGGRSSLMWMLAAGQPREGKLVTLMAPRTRRPGDYEVRAVRFWQRTLWLPRGKALSNIDLHAINNFRTTLLELQRPLPHRLAGVWHVYGSGGGVRHIQCIGSEADPAIVEAEGEEEDEEEEDAPRRVAMEQDVLLDVSGGAQPMQLRSRADRPRWYCTNRTCYCDEESGGAWLKWSDGSWWHRASGNALGNQSEYPVLGTLGPEVVQKFRTAGNTLLELTPADDIEAGDERGEEERRKKWPGRLVPLLPRLDAAATLTASRGRGRCGGRSHKRGQAGNSVLTPFDLDAAEAMLEEFNSSLIDEDYQSSSGDEADANEEESDPDDDLPISVSQDGIDEEYMWKLAMNKEWTASHSRKLCFVESAIAMPRNATCVDCERDDKMFSKNQLARHPDERRCRDCVAKALLGARTDEGGRRENLPRVQPATKPMPLAQSAGFSVIASTPPKCAACGVQLSKDNCSSAQRAKVPSRRRCNNCVGSARGA